jgi:hypothetical protein
MRLRRSNQFMISRQAAIDSAIDEAQNSYSRPVRYNQRGGRNNYAPAATAVATGGMIRIAARRRPARADPSQLNGRTGVAGLHVSAHAVGRFASEYG